jgi:hypothetical protein
VQVRVRTATPDEVTCDLPRSEPTQGGEAVFQYSGQPLPAGHSIRLQLGHVPFAWMRYGRWIAAAVLLALIAAAAAVIMRQRSAAATRGPSPHRPAKHERRRQTVG